jgi:hypothetical protein
MHHGPPSRVLSRASRLSAIRPCLGFRLPSKNSCLRRPLPPCLKPPHPGASALRPAYRVVDHRSVLLVSFCQDVMQVGRAKPAYLSSFKKSWSQSPRSIWIYLSNSHMRFRKEKVCPLKLAHTYIYAVVYQIGSLHRWVIGAARTTQKKKYFDYFVFNIVDYGFLRSGARH